MSEAVFVDHFRSMPHKFARKCKLLVEGQPGEHVVGYWGGYDTSNQSPNVLTFDAQILPTTDLNSQWISLTGSRNDLTICQRSDSPGIEQGQALSCIDANSYPNLEEEWEIVAPSGYSEWLATADPQKREVVIDAIREYDNFYRANEPFSATEREVYAVVGGWGLYIYAGEWADHPEAENIAFTLADAEPYYSLRRLPNGELVCKALIT